MTEAKGVAIRAGLLVVGGMLIGGWLVGAAMKVAGRAIHLLLLGGIALLIGGAATYEVKKHIGGGDEQQRQLRAI